MSMFGSNLKATILAYESIFTAAGFDFTAAAAKPDSLKAFIEARESAARASATAEAGVNFLQSAGLAPVEGHTAAAVVKAALATKDATITLYTEGLKNAGVIAQPAKEGEAITAADIKTAIETRASQKAAATIAATGHAPIPQTSDANSDTIPETLAEIQTQLAATKDPVRAGLLAARANTIRNKAQAASGLN